jgi:hypothetical protein
MCVCVCARVHTRMGGAHVWHNVLTCDLDCIACGLCSVIAIATSRRLASLLFNGLWSGGGGGRPLEHKFYLSSPYGAEIKTVQHYTCTPPRCLHSLDRANFMFLLCRFLLSRSNCVNQKPVCSRECLSILGFHHEQCLLFVYNMQFCKLSFRAILVIFITRNECRGSCVFCGQWITSTSFVGQMKWILECGKQDQQKNLVW